MSKQTKENEFPVELFGGPHDGRHLNVMRLTSSLGYPVEPNEIHMPSPSATVYFVPDGSGWRRAIIDNIYERSAQGKYQHKRAILQVPNGAKTMAKPLKADWNF